MPSGCFQHIFQGDFSGCLKDQFAPQLDRCWFEAQLGKWIKPRCLDTMRKTYGPDNVIKTTHDWECSMIATYQNADDWAMLPMALFDRRK